MPGLTAAITVVAFVPAVGELVVRLTHLSGELARKLVHAGSGIAAATLPQLMSYREIAVLGVALAAVMLVVHRFRLLAALNGVERTSYGEVWFPLGIATLAALFPSAVAYVYGTLVLGLADAAAALAGVRVGRRRLPLACGKTFSGSAAFCAERDLWRRLARPLAPRLFGANKTWRGVVVMVTATTAFVLVQRALDLRTLALVDYGAATTLLLGPALGAAYSLAELPNSFVKRRLGVRPGARARRHASLQYVADQGDSVAGAVVVLALFVHDLAALTLVAAFGFALHAAFDRVLHASRIKQAVA